MTAGYYKNHIDYNRHVSYGKSVSYGKHINYNKPDDAALCGFSTYNNGTSEVNEDFEYIAPLYLNGDYVEWNDPANPKTIGSGWYHEIKITTDTDTAYFLNITCSTTSAIMRININAGNLNIAGNDDTNTESWFTFGGMLTLGDEYILRIEYNGTDFIYYKDGVEFDRDPITLAAGFTYDNVLWGARTPFLNKMEGLYFYGKDSNLGDFNFISNQDDGLNVISSNSIIATIDEDIAGSSQIKADGTSSTAYEWTVKYFVPFTGPVKLNNDMLTFIDPLGALDYSSFSWEYETDTDAITTNDFADRFCDHYNTGADVSSMLIQMRAPVVNNNYLQLQFKDASSTLFYNKIASIDVSGRKIIKVTFDQPTSTIKTFIDGVEIVAITQVVTISGGFNLDGYIYGSRSIGANYITMDFYRARMTIPSLPLRMGSINFVGRLWSATDPNGNKYIDSNGNAYVFVDGTPKGAVAPYDLNGVPTDWPTTYLVSDTPCDDSRLLIRDDIAQIRDGVWQYAAW